MSFVETDQSDTAPVEDDGQGVPVETVDTPQEQYEYIDLDQFGDYHAPVKINGEESSVPLRELTQGYQRQQDYTLKTQELSQQRQELSAYAAIADALENDPAKTLRILSEAYGVDLTGNGAPSPVEQVPLDPVEAKLQELQAKIDGFEQERQNQTFESELADLSGRFGIDGPEIVQFAIQNELGSLEHAALSMYHAKQTLASETEAADKQRVEAKREATVVNGGSATSRGAVAAPQGSASSWEEAWQQT